MERITLFIRTAKSSGTIKLRFRLTDGRAVQLYHKSGIQADLKDLAKFDINGSVKSKVTIFNRKLKAEIDNRIKIMSSAYVNLCQKMNKTHISCELFEKQIAILLNPETPIEQSVNNESMINRFGRFIEQAYKENVFNEKRMKSYICVKDCIERFLSIKHLKKISTDEFTSDLLKELYDFFADEFLYVPKYPKLFKGMSERAIPTTRRDQNTVVTRMNKVQAFFNELLEQEEIEVSPFHKLGRKRKANMMREVYDEPRFLYREELLKILATEVPATLQETKDAFLLQCAFGCRISDFQKLTMDKVDVTDEGIPYIHYLPLKTMRENIRKEEVQTPIVRYAFEILKRRPFDFAIIRYPSGKSGYNVKIRQLLEHCGIDRKVKSFDAEKNDNVFSPIFKEGSSKLCRSTHIDMMSKVQLDPYAAELHRRGSTAVNRYTMTQLRDRFVLMCLAFDQPQYKVDKDLNIIDALE